MLNSPAIARLVARLGNQAADREAQFGLDGFGDVNGVLDVLSCFSGKLAARELRCNISAMPDTRSAIEG